MFAMVLGVVLVCRSASVRNMVAAFQGALELSLVMITVNVFLQILMVLCLGVTLGAVPRSRLVLVAKVSLKFFSRRI